MTLSKSFLWIVVLGFLAIAIWFGVYYQKQMLLGKTASSPPPATSATPVEGEAAARSRILESLQITSTSTAVEDAAARAAILKSLQTTNKTPAEQAAARAKILESLNN